MLLTSDLHLDDSPDNEYRWDIFRQLNTYNNEEIFILGDLCDRADRHSGALVNRLVQCLLELTVNCPKVTILCGNHDLSIKGPFWKFLSELPRVEFVTMPKSVGKLLLLPYSANPKEQWAEIPFDLYNTVFMHQTVFGAKTADGRAVDPHNVPEFPAHLTVYSGDIHVPQVIKNVTYVGAPHHVRFGDNHVCRVLLLDDDFSIAKAVHLLSKQKLVLNIQDLADLEQADTRPGDQLRVRCTVQASQMAYWPVTQQAIMAWASHKQLNLISVESIIETSPSVGTSSKFDFDSDPHQVLTAFCQAEGVGEEILRRGQLYLAEGLKHV